MINELKKDKSVNKVPLAVLRQMNENINRIRNNISSGDGHINELKKQSNTNNKNKNPPSPSNPNIRDKMNSILINNLSNLHSRALLSNGKLLNMMDRILLPNYRTHYYQEVPLSLNIS